MKFQVLIQKTLNVSAHATTLFKTKPGQKKNNNKNL